MRPASRKRPRRRLAPGPREGPLIVFIHIPKCAGTTFTSILRANHPNRIGFLGNVFRGSAGHNPSRRGTANLKPLIRLRAAGDVGTRDMDVLSGHLPLAIRHHIPGDARYVTFLRDPIERTLSQYFGLAPPIREDSSLEEVIANRLIYDNLQTRMLCDADEPFGDVTPEMLEQAKQNLSSPFMDFGLVERFDESLVRFRWRLGLRSIVYVRRRIGTGSVEEDDAAELRRAAARFNAFDTELYTWAAAQFDRLLAEQDADFRLELAGLRLALSSRTDPGPPPSEADLTRDQLWERLVTTQATLLQRESELVDMTAALDEEYRSSADLRELNRNVVELNRRFSGADEAMPKLRKRSDRSPAQRLEQQTSRLAELRARIQDLEATAEARGEADLAVGALEELSQLRTAAETVERRIQVIERRQLNGAKRKASSRAHPPDGPTE